MRIYLIRHGATQGNLLKKYIGKTQEPLCQEGIRRLKEKAPLFQGLGVGACFISPSLRCRQTAQILFPNLSKIPIGELQECDFGEFEGKSYRELTGNPAYQAWIDSGGTLPFPGGEGREAFRRRSLEGFFKVLEYALGYGQVGLAPLYDCPESFDDLPGLIDESLGFLDEGPGPFDEGQKFSEDWQDSLEDWQEFLKSSSFAPRAMPKTQDAFTEKGLQGIQDIQEKPLVIVAHGGTFMNLLEALALEERSFYDWHLDNGQGLEIRLTKEDALHLIRERPMGRLPVLWTGEILG